MQAAFFLDRNYDNIWIKFKLERLLNFCYKCGVLQHVTGICKQMQVTVTTPSGISAKLYGPWLRAESCDSLLFINTPEIGELDRRKIKIEQETSAGLLKYITNQSRTAGETSQLLEDCEMIQAFNKEELCNATEMCPELDSLNITLNRQSLGNTKTLQEIVMNQFRDSKVDLDYLATWASKILKQIAVKKDLNRRRIIGLDPNFYSMWA